MSNTNQPGGKGDKQRPVEDREKFDRNWDIIFKKKKEGTSMPPLVAPKDNK